MRERRKAGWGLGTRLVSDCIGLKVKLADLDVDMLWHWTGWGTIHYLQR